MNMNGLLIYGVPFAMVGAVILFVIARYVKVSSEGGLVFTAAWTTAGFLLSTYLKPLEQLWPGMPTHLPVIMNAILLFGAMMGFMPGENMRKLYTRLTKVYHMVRGTKSDCCQDDTFFRQ